ncbi:uncharacterized protein [Diabrotica undecimpunctata]|uniref:uncharacterized protein n=1 Tax=Diabrotica undecimpunctata TaxID=50387 RepID=UPI003B63CDAE
MGFRLCYMLLFVYSNKIFGAYSRTQQIISRSNESYIDPTFIDSQSKAPEKFIADTNLENLILTNIEDDSEISTEYVTRSKVFNDTEKSVTILSSSTENLKDISPNLLSTGSAVSKVSYGDTITDKSTQTVTNLDLVQQLNITNTNLTSIQEISMKDENLFKVTSQNTTEESFNGDLSAHSTLTEQEDRLENLSQIASDVPLTIELSANGTLENQDLLQNSSQNTLEQTEKTAKATLENNDLFKNSSQNTLDETEKSTNATLPEKKISEIIFAILQHYKQADPLGIPGVPIPDPMPIPDMSKSFPFGRMFLKNSNLFGLKNFRIEHVTANISEMKVQASLSIEVLTVRGNYTLSTWVSRAKGPYLVKLGNVSIIAVASLEVEQNGTLSAQDMDMDILFATIDMDFQNLGFFANMFQGMMNSVGTFIFESIKPFVLSEANTNIRNDINKEIKNIQRKFPTSVSSVDQLIYEIRKTVRSKGYDPYYVPDYTARVGFITVHLTHTWLYGLSSFYRTKEITFEMKNKTVYIFLEGSTGKLVGTTNWDVSLVPGSIYRDGSVAFTINYLKVQIIASQNMDTSHPPTLDDIQLELGNIQMRFNGLGNMDYLIEFGVNILPNVLRYQIMDAIEKPVKFKIQEALDRVNVERIIMKNVDQLDRGMGFENIQLLL